MNSDSLSKSMYAELGADALKFIALLKANVSQLILQGKVKNIINGGMSRPTESWFVPDTVDLPVDLVERLDRHYNNWDCAIKSGTSCEITYDYNTTACQYSFRESEYQCLVVPEYGTVVENTCRNMDGSELAVVKGTLYEKCVKFESNPEFSSRFNKRTRHF